MNPDQQRALTGLNLGVAAMKVGSDVRTSRAAAEKVTASNQEQLAEMRKQGAADAKRDAERNRILQQQTDASIKEEQKRTKLLEDQIAGEKKAKEREEASKRNQERHGREAEAKERAREAERKGKQQAKENAEKPKAKAFAYFLTRSALQGRDELTGEQREKLVGQLRMATGLYETDICDQGFILEHLVRPAMIQCIEEEDDGKKDGLISILENLGPIYELWKPNCFWLAKLQVILTDGEGISAHEQEWIDSIKAHFKISDEELTEVRNKEEEGLASLYLNMENTKALLYLYAQVVLLDGDGCTDLERDKIIELVLKRVNSTTTPQICGGKMSAAMAQKGLKSALVACKADKMAGTTQDAVKKRVTENYFEHQYGEHIISDLEDLATVDGAISVEQSEFLSFVNSQLMKSKEFGQKARLQAVAYLLMVLGFWDLDGITDEESAKIGELLLQWDETLNEETLPELIKKCELSYEKDTREQNTEEVIRSIGFLHTNLKREEKARFIGQMQELAAVDGPVAEQQQAFIQWVWEEIGFFKARPSG